MTARMSEVELVDTVDRSTPARPEPGDPVRRSWPRRNARWWVPVAAVAALGLVGTQVSLDARERARVAALAEIPGVVPPTGPDIGVVWRADPSYATVMQGGSMVDGLLVGGRTNDEGGIEIVALDPDTGVQSWSTSVTLPPANPQPDGLAPTSWVTCTAVAHGGDPAAVCVSQQYGENIVGLPPSTIWVIDPTDGRIVSTRSIPGTSGVTTTDDAMVVATRVDRDGGPARTDAGMVAWSVTATDAVDGTELWTFTTPMVDVLGREDGPQGANASVRANMTTSGHEVVLATDNHAWILDGSGRAVRDLDMPPGSWIQPARAGAYVVSEYSGDYEYTGRLLLPDGTDVPLDESAAWLPVDDGSAPDVVLTAGAGPANTLGMSARDASTGRLLWHHEEDATNSALLLDGVVYTTTNDGLVATDARSGDVRWTTKLGHQAMQLSTDGRYLLVPGSGALLQAYQLGNGHLAWSVDLKEQVAGDQSTSLVQGFQSSGHDARLFVWRADGSVAVLG